MGEIPYYKALRTIEADDLDEDMEASHLLKMVAKRAKRTFVPNHLNLKVNEALLGDHKRYGQTRQQYRSALRRLVKGGFITIKSTIKGHVVTLLPNRCWDINAGANQPSSQPIANHQPTTKKNDKKDKNDKKNNYTALFIEFWEAYPRKTDKQKASKIFKRSGIDRVLLDIILKALEWQKESNSWKEGFIPYPSTYLNNSRWEDEPTKTLSQSERQRAELDEQFARIDAKKALEEQSHGNE